PWAPQNGARHPMAGPCKGTDKTSNRRTKRVLHTALFDSCARTALSPWLLPGILLGALDPIVRVKSKVIGMHVSRALWMTRSSRWTRGRLTVNALCRRD